MIKSLGDSLIAAEIEGTHYEAMIKPFLKESLLYVCNKLLKMSVW